MVLLCLVGNGMRLFSQLRFSISAQCFYSGMMEKKERKKKKEGGKDEEDGRSMKYTGFCKRHI